MSNHYNEIPKPKPVIETESITVRILKYILPGVILILGGLFGFEKFNSMTLTKQVQSKHNKADSLQKVVDYTREQLAYKEAVLSYIKSVGDSTLHGDHSHMELTQALYNIRYNSGIRIDSIDSKTSE